MDENMTRKAIPEDGSVGRKQKGNLTIQGLFSSGEDETFWFWKAKLELSEFLETKKKEVS
jgi:hypothetical protein